MAVVDEQSEFGMSDAIDKIATAMSKAQGEMTTASKDKKNPFYGSKYADLASCWSAVREPLSNNGLSVVQLPSTTTIGKVTVLTILMHESGQWISTTLQMQILREKKGEGFINAIDPQAVGSAITYARRYALCAVCGIAPENEDDDGNRASDVAPKKTARQLLEEQKKAKESQQQQAMAGQESAATQEGLPSQSSTEQKTESKPEPKPEPKSKAKASGNGNGSATANGNGNGHTTAGKTAGTATATATAPTTPPAQTATVDPPASTSQPAATNPPASAAPTTATTKLQAPTTGSQSARGTDPCTPEQQARVKSLFVEVKYERDDMVAAVEFWGKRKPCKLVQLTQDQANGLIAALVQKKTQTQGTERF